MKYTKEMLHGIVYNHQSGSPRTKRIIRLNTPTERYNHTTCNGKTGVSESPWFTDDEAISWLEAGIWVVQDQSDKVVNDYHIF